MDEADAAAAPADSNGGGSQACRKRTKARPYAVGM